MFVMRLCLIGRSEGYTQSLTNMICIYQQLMKITAMNLRQTKEVYMGRFGRRQRCGYIIISVNRRNETREPH